MSAGTLTANPETQPLLSSSKPPSYHDESLQDPSAAGGSDEESNSTLVAVDADAPRTRSWSTIVFQSVIVLLSLIVLGLFIKGFIDADDAQVWFCLDWRSAGSYSVILVRLGQGSQECTRWWTQRRRR